MHTSHSTAGHYPDLQGKVAIVTGGATGIGYAIARNLIRQGMRVAIGDINEEAAWAAATELGANTRHFTWMCVHEHPSRRGLAGWTIR